MKRLFLQKSWPALPLMLALFLILTSGMALAQTDTADDDSSDADEACHPALTVSYDAMASEAATVKDLQIAYSLAKEKFDQSLWKESIKYYWKILVNDDKTYKIGYSKLTQVYFEIARIVESDQKAYLDSALIVAYRGLQKYSDNTTLHFYAGRIQRMNNNDDCALPHYQSLVKYNPKEASYLEILSGLYFQMDDERCLEAQQQLVALNPDNAEAQNKLFLMMRHFDKDPLDAMRAAFIQDSTNTRIAFQYGKGSYDAGNYKAAIRAFNAQLKTDDKNLTALGYLGQSYEGLSDYSKAIAVYEKMIAIDPNSLKAYCWKASAHAQLNQFTTARSLLLKARGIDTDSGLPYLIMGNVYEKAVEYYSSRRGKEVNSYDDKLVYEKAAEEYRKAERDPNLAGIASTRREVIKALFRSAEDKHLHNYRENITDENYAWIR